MVLNLNLIRGYSIAKALFFRNAGLTPKEKDAIYEVFYSSERYVKNQEIAWEPDDMWETIGGELSRILTVSAGKNKNIRIFSRIKQYRSLTLKLEKIKTRQVKPQYFAKEAAELSSRYLDDVLGFYFIIDDEGMYRKKMAKMLTAYSNRVEEGLKSRFKSIQITKIRKESRLKGFEAVNLFIQGLIDHKDLGKLPIKIQFRFKTALYGESAMYYVYKRYNEWKLPPWAEHIDFRVITTFRELQTKLFNNFKEYSRGSVPDKPFSILKHIILSDWSAHFSLGSQIDKDGFGNNRDSKHLSGSLPAGEAGSPLEKCSLSLLSTAISSAIFSRRENTPALNSNAGLKKVKNSSSPLGEDKEKEASPFLTENGKLLINNILKIDKRKQTARYKNVDGADYDFIILEVAYSWFWEELRQVMGLKIMLLDSFSSRLLRKEERDKVERGYTAEENLRVFLLSEIEEVPLVIQPQICQADIIIDLSRYFASLINREIEIYRRIDSACLRIAETGSPLEKAQAENKAIAPIVDINIADKLLKEEAEEIKRFVNIWKNDTHISDDVAFPVAYQFIMSAETQKAINENGVYVFNLSRIKTTEELLELFWDLVDDGWTKVSVPYQEAFLNTILHDSSAYKDLSMTSHYDADDFLFDENIYTHLDKDDLVLDVGAGCGAHIARIIAKRVKKVYGTEISPKIITQAQKHIQEEGITNIELQLVKNTRLPYKNNLFDRIIISRFFFNLMPKMRIRILDSINRVLKPEGILNIRTYSASVSELSWDVCDWEEYLEKSGFKVNRDSVRCDYEKDEILITVKKRGDARVISGNGYLKKEASSPMGIPKYGEPDFWPGKMKITNQNLVNLELKKSDEFFHRDPGAFKNGVEGSWFDGFRTVERDNAASIWVSLVPHYYMRTALAFNKKSALFQRADDNFTGNMRYLGHTETSISLNSTSMSDSGIGRWSSLSDQIYNSIASLILAIASSGVSPWDAHPRRAGTNTEYPPSASSSITTLNRFNIFVPPAIKDTIYLGKSQVLDRRSYIYTAASPLESASSSPAGDGRESSVYKKGLSFVAKRALRYLTGFLNYKDLFGAAREEAVRNFPSARDIRAKQEEEWGLLGESIKILTPENQTKIAELLPIIREIDSLEEGLSRLSDNELRNKTNEFKSRFKAGETLDGLLPEAFAVVREAFFRVSGKRLYGVQMLGGMVIHQQKVAEIKTGEGKTFVAMLPAYLRALSGQKVHIITHNPYLSLRDFQKTESLYQFLGVPANVRMESRKYKILRAAYDADVLFTTMNTGFDLMRGIIPKSLLTGSFAIIDEADYALIDLNSNALVLIQKKASAKNSLRLLKRYLKL